MADLAQDPADESGRLFFSFEKFPPYVCVATHEFDPRFALGPRGVGAVAIALDNAHQWSENGIYQIDVVGRCWFEQFGDAAAVATFAPMVEHRSVRFIGHPEVTGLGFAAAGFKIADGGFVNLAVKSTPMLVLNFTVNDGEPIGCEQRPVGKGFAMNDHSHAGEHFSLPVIGQVANKAVVHYFGDEAGGGDAAFLQARRKLADHRFSDGITDENVFAAHDPQCCSNSSAPRCAATDSAGIAPSAPAA